MNETTRQTELEAARNELAKARQVYDQKKGKRGFRAAAETVEFWGNKVAFLTCVKL